MKQDFLGSPIDVGDRVVFIDTDYQSFERGTIIKLGEKMATISREQFQNEHYRNIMGYGKTCRYYDRIIKYDGDKNEQS